MCTPYPKLVSFPNNKIWFPHSPQVLGLSPGWLEYFQSMFQAASQGSPMTVTINGENVEDINSIEITQNAADEESPLTCVPDCPQEEYEYNYEVHT